MRFLYLLALLVTAAGATHAADDWPAKPLRLIVPSGSGSPPDIRARWLAERLSAALKQSVVVDNKPGAGGAIATEAAVRSAADGHTLLLVHQGTMAINPHVYERLPYDPLKDLAPVTRLVVSAMLLAVPQDSPANSVADLIRLGKDSPGRLPHGSGGSGSPPHLAAALFNRATAMQAVHVPYKTSAAAALDLVGGRISFTLDSLAIQLPQVKAGRLKALAVSSSQRLASLPDVPTISEAAVVGFEYWSWMGISVPAATPARLVGGLNRAIVAILATAEAREWFGAQGGEPMGETPQQFAAFIREEHARWGGIVRDAGIKLE
jgi:tripartite-type tricarboxylate transporter receptor subunit TctC